MSSAAPTGGDLVYGEPHGYGSMLIPSLGDVGKGVERVQATGSSSLLPRLDRDEGERVDSVIGGYGIYVRADGVRYEGKHKDNNNDGYGVQT